MRRALSPPVEHLPGIRSADPRVAVPVNQFHLTRGEVDLEGIVSHCSFPVLHGNGVVTRGQRNSKPALVVRFEGGHHAILPLDEELGIRERFRIRNALSRGAAMNGTHRDRPLDPSFRFGLWRGRWFRQDDVRGQSEKYHGNWDEMQLAHN